jgi:hypothetical protein
MIGVPPICRRSREMAANQTALAGFVEEVATRPVRAADKLAFANLERMR